MPKWKVRVRFTLFERWPKPNGFSSALAIGVRYVDTGDFYSSNIVGLGVPVPGMRVFCLDLLFFCVQVEHA